MRIAGSVLAVAVLAAAGACTRPSQAVRVGFVFGNDCTLGPVSLTTDEQAHIKATAFKTLQQAFAGFRVDFAEDPASDRSIRLNRYLFGSGSTQIGFIPSPWDISGLKATPFRWISTPISTLAPIRTSLEKLIGNSLARTTFTWSSFRFGLLRLLHSVATSS